MRPNQLYIFIYLYGYGHMSVDYIENEIVNELEHFVVVAVVSFWLYCEMDALVIAFTLI